MTKIRENYSQFMRYIFVVDFVLALWEKKLIKHKKKKLKHKSEREMQREM